MFEMIRVIPTVAGQQSKTENVSWVIEQSTDQSGCDTNYIVNPLDDFNNYKNFGYVNQKATKQNGSGVIKFDHRIMKLTPRDLNTDLQ